MKLRRRIIQFIAMDALFGMVTLLNTSPCLSDDNPERWEEAIAAFETADKESKPEKHGVLFVGSSSIRLWNLKTHFPHMKAINRGFGGSQLSDSLHYADRIVIPYAPSNIVVYAGDNDIAVGETAEIVLDDFRKFVKKVHDKLPDAHIHFVAIKPSIKRWNLVKEMRKANRLIRHETEKNARLSFIDIDTPMIGNDGKPIQDLFVKDGLHLSDKGYKIWSQLVRESVAKTKTTKRKLEPTAN